MSAIIFIVIDVNVFWAGVGIVGPEQFICYTFFFFFGKCLLSLIFFWMKSYQVLLITFKLPAISTSKFSHAFFKPSHCLCYGVILLIGPESPYFSSSSPMLSTNISFWIAKLASAWNSLQHIVSVQQKYSIFLLVMLQAAYEWESSPELVTGSCWIQCFRDSVAAVFRVCWIVN